MCHMVFSWKLFSALATASLTCWFIAFNLLCLSFKKKIVLDYPEQAIFWMTFYSLPLKSLHILEALSTAYARYIQVREELDNLRISSQIFLIIYVENDHWVVGSEI